MQTTNKCKCCGSETEPILDYTPHFNGGFEPESVSIEVMGYDDLCEGCDDHWQEIVYEGALQSDTYNGDDLPF